MLRVLVLMRQSGGWWGGSLVSGNALRWSDAGDDGAVLVLDDPRCREGVKE